MLAVAYLGLLAFMRLVLVLFWFDASGSWFWFMLVACGEFGWLGCGFYLDFGVTWFVVWCLGLVFCTCWWFAG